MSLFVATEASSGRLVSRVSPACRRAMPAGDRRSFFCVPPTGKSVARFARLSAGDAGLKTGGPFPASSPGGTGCSGRSTPPAPKPLKRERLRPFPGGPYTP